MKKARFLISTFAAAGFGTTHPLQAAITTVTGPATNSGDDPNRGKLFQVFKQDHLYTLAGHASHSSHSSHSSHASHASHQSGYGGSAPRIYTPPPAYKPQPLYTPPSYAPFPPPPSPPRSQSPASGVEAAPPSGDGLKPLSGRTELFNSIVRRVQLGLLAFGYYDGPINGVVGPKMKAALKQFQSAFHLTVTGTITPEVLDALRVSSGAAGPERG